MEQNVGTTKKKGGLGKASVVLGVISLVLALLPLMSGWFLMISWLMYLTVGLGLLLGIIAVVKKQSNAIVGIVLNVVALVMPFFLAETYAERGLESASKATSGMLELMEEME